MSFEIVVARYKEDTSWTSKYNNVVIYTKGQELPNLGREASTYLYHMINRFDTLADRTLFLQGSPFDHELKPIEEHERSTKSFDTIINSNIPFDTHGWCSDDNLVSHPDKPVTKNHQIHKEEIVKFWDEFMGTTYPERLGFCWGAQFSASKEAIQTIGKPKLERLFEWSMNGDDYLRAVMFEIMWPEIFKVRRRFLRTVRRACP